MKKITIKSVLITAMLALFVFNSNNATACVDPDTTVVVIRVDYDTVNAPLITEAIITLTNLRLMNEAANKVCACGLTKWSAMFTNLKYIAFVYAGTTNPYTGFAKFDSAAASSAAWNNSTSAGDWAGYVATVVNAGLKSTEPVDLIIRASTPPGVAYTLQGDSARKQLSLVEAVKSESLGTDEWSNTTNNLVNAHRGIQKFSSATTISYKAMPSSYFMTTDSSILNNLASSVKTFFSANTAIKVYPNPSKSNLQVEINTNYAIKANLKIYSLTGTIIKEIPTIALKSGVNTIDLSEYIKTLSSGQYVLGVLTEQGSISKAILIE